MSYPTSLPFTRITINGHPVKILEDGGEGEAQAPLCTTETDRMHYTEDRLHTEHIASPQATIAPNRVPPVGEREPRVDLQLL